MIDVWERESMIDVREYGRCVWVRVDRYVCDNTQSSKVLIYYNIIITSCIVPKYWKLLNWINVNNWCINDIPDKNMFIFIIVRAEQN